MNQRKTLLQDGLAGNTLIASPDGRTRKIETLAQYNLTIDTLTITPTGKITKTQAKNFKQTQQTTHFYRITTYNGHTLQLTKNQQLLLADGQWAPAHKLQTGDVLKTGLLKINPHLIKNDITLQLNYILIVEEIELKNPKPSYSFTVENHQNLLIGQEIQNSLSLICVNN